jgi:hypothetical protein
VILRRFFVFFVRSFSTPPALPGLGVRRHRLALGKLICLELSQYARKILSVDVTTELPVDRRTIDPRSFSASEDAMDASG